jgi:glycosyltransferase involved in cell wall biosynthesis
VTSSFPIRADGSEAAGSFVADLASALARETPLRVVAPGARAERESWADGIEVFRYAAPAEPLSTLRPWHPAEAAWILRVLRGGAAAAREALGDDGSHVLALWGLPCGEWARRAARARNVAYSVWLLGSDVWSLGRIPFVRGTLARVIREASRAYADGYRLGEDASALSRAPVEFLPSTREIEPASDALPRAQAPFRLLFLGRWHPNKGVDILLDALSLLGDDDWALIEHVRIEGGGPLRPLVEMKVRDLKARGRPVDAGRFLDKREAAAAIAESDWILIPSRIESIPVVFSDAMKLARPVVASPVGDLPRLLAEHPVGICAGEVSADAFADALRRALRTSPASHADALHRAALPFSLERSIVPRILAGSRDDAAMSG